MFLCIEILRRRLESKEFHKKKAPYDASEGLLMGYQRENAFEGVRACPTGGAPDRETCNHLGHRDGWSHLSGGLAGFIRHE